MPVSNLETARAPYQPLWNLRGEPEQTIFTIEGLAGDATVFQPIRDNKRWEPHVVAVLERIIQPDFVCLDVGANIGAITLPMAHLASSGHVYAFEASPTAYELLQRNIAGNGLKNATAVNAAITDHSGDKAEIFWSDQALGCAHMADQAGHRTGTREEVRTLALDDYGFRLDRVDFIKMDVEGGEAAALAGCRRLLKEYRPPMIIEYNPAPMEAYNSKPRRELYDVLTALYPRIEIITFPHGILDPVPDWEHLDQALHTHTYCDLLCTHPD